MNTNTIKVASVTFLLGLSIGYFALPAKVVTKTETKTVEKLVEDQNKTTKNNKVVVVTETTAPDGTKTKRTEVTDKSVTTADTKTSDDVSSDSKSEKTVTYAKNELSISALVGIQIGDGFTPSYGLSVQKRVLGPIYVGAFGFTNRLAGVSLGLSF